MEPPKILLFLLLSLFLISNGATAGQVYPTEANRGHCRGRTTLTNAFGLVSDHVGNGNYSFGAVCEWLIEVPGAQQIVIQLHSAFIFGRVAIFSDRFAESAPVADLVQQNGLGPKSRTEWADYHFGFFDPITINGPLALVRFVVESDLYSWYTEIAAESWSGITFAYRAVGPAITQPTVCQQPASTTAPQGIFSDWAWMSGVPNPTAPNCIYSITPTSKTLFTIKNFQPNSTSATLNVFIDNVPQWSLSATSDWNKLYDDAVDTDPLFVYYDRSLVVGAGSTLRVEYVGVSGTSNPGFVAEWWPYPQSMCTNNPTRVTATASAPNNQCGWFMSHAINFTSDSVIGTLNSGDNPFCEFRLVNNLPRSEEIFFIVKDFDIGSGTNDAIIFSTEDNRWSTVVSREFDRLARVIIPSQLTGSRNFLITYSFGPNPRTAGTGRGFNILWGTRTGLAQCLNSSITTLPSSIDASLNNMTIEFPLSPALANTTVDRDRWVILTSENPRATISAICSLNSTLSQEYQLNSGRGYTYGASSRVVDIYTPEPDTGNRIQVFRFNNFGLPSRATTPTALQVIYFVPSFAALDFEAPSVRTASADGVPFHIGAFQLANGIHFSAYNSSTGRAYDPPASYVPLEEYAFLVNARERSSQVYSVDVVPLSNTAVIAINLNDLFDPTASLRYMLWMVPIDNNLFEIYDYLDLEGDDVGETMSSSPDALWLFVSYSAQIFGVMHTTPRAGFLPHSWIWYPESFYLMSARMRDGFIFVAGCSLQAGSSRISYDFIRYDAAQDTWASEGLVTLADSLCTVKGLVSADINSEGSLIVLGSSAAKTVYVISSNSSSPACVTMPDDPSFGKFTRISANTSEILITGVRLYSFDTDTIISHALSNSTQCLSKQDFPSSFYPSRFAFAGDDWSSISGGLPIEVSVNEESINIVLEPNTESRDPDTTARRYVLKSVPGSEFAFENGISSIRQCALGTYGPSTSFSPCRPCPFGTYQSSQGSLSCLDCLETAYCPIGSVLQINGSGITVNVSTPRFTTANGDGPDSVIWGQLLPPNIYGWFLWIIWLMLVLLGFWVQQKWECTARARPYQEKVAETLESMDPEPIEYFDVYKNDFAEQGEPKGGLFCLALLVFLLIAYIFIMVFFASYRQYDGTQESIPNNVRTSNLNPYFSAPGSQKQLLDWLLSQGFTLSIRLSGYTFSDCITLCGAQTVESIGCFYAGTAIPCSRNANVSCKAAARDSCELSWRLPSRVDLTSVSVFSFSIANAFLQELEVQVEMEPQKGITSLFSEVSQSQDTVELSPGFSSEKVQLPASAAANEILFGVIRNYELNYALLSSEKAGFSYQGLDWRMQAIFLPVQANVVSGTIAYNQFYSSSESNTVRLAFTKPNYYVANTEQRVKNGSEVALIAILVTTAVLDVFEVLGSLFKIIATIIGKLFGKVQKVRRNSKRASSVEMDADPEANKPNKFESFVGDLLKRQLDDTDAKTDDTRARRKSTMTGWLSAAPQTGMDFDSRIKLIVQMEIEKALGKGERKDD